MTDNILTRKYLKDMQAVLINSKIIVQNTIIDSKVCVYLKQTYRKRNNKTCYVEVNRTWFPLDWKRTTTYTHHHGITINDYNSFHYIDENTVLDKDYKQELIEKYKLKYNIII